MIGKTEGRTNFPEGVVLVECFRWKSYGGVAGMRATVAFIK